MNTRTRPVLGRTSTCLWLTRQVPYPPLYGGDVIYTSRLLESVADLGVETHVLCFDHGHGTELSIPDRQHLHWHVLPLPRSRDEQSVISALPSMAYRFRSRAFDRRLRHLLEEPWDAVIIDKLNLGWVLGTMTRRFVNTSRPPRLIYLSHNHETDVRRQFARDRSLRPLVRLALVVDTAKVARLERRLVTGADAVTAITEEDAERFARDHPGTRSLVLTPGYDGTVAARRTISDATPRCAIIAGSFGWEAKRRNLEAFLDVGARRLSEAGVRLIVAGAAPDGYPERVAARFPAVRFVSPVDDLAPLLDEARLGLVPEPVGGGFKLKALTYVFHRVPMAALHGSVAGLPLRQGNGIHLYESLEALTDGILSLIDDLPELNRTQDVAFATCAHSFDWSARGELLLDLIEGCVPERPA